MKTVFNWKQASKAAQPFAGKVDSGVRTTWPSVGSCRVRPISTQGHKKFSQTTTEKTWFLQQLFLQKHLFLARSINRYRLPSTTAQTCKLLPRAAEPTRCPSVSPRPCHPAPLCSKRTSQEGKEEVPWPCPGNVQCSPSTAEEEELQEGKGTCLRAHSTAVAEQGHGSMLLGRRCHHKTNPSCS